jgi:hypothetical protein
MKSCLTLWFGLRLLSRPKELIILRKNQYFFRFETFCEVDEANGIPEDDCERQCVGEGELPCPVHPPVQLHEREHRL